MVVATIIGCILMIISGKKAAKRGESVVKMNQDWHREYDEAAARAGDEKAIKKLQQKQE